MEKTGSRLLRSTPAPIDGLVVFRGLVVLGLEGLGVLRMPDGLVMYVVQALVSQKHEVSFSRDGSVAGMMVRTECANERGFRDRPRHVGMN